MRFRTAFLLWLLGTFVCCGWLAFAESASPLAIVSTSSLDGRTVGIRFNQALDPASAARAANYHFNGQAVVQQARLRPGGYSVEVLVGGLTGTNYTVTAKNIRDLSQCLATCSAQGIVQQLRAEDIGQSTHAGSTFSCAPGVIEVEAAGRDIWDNADSFHFIHQKRTGDFDVCARVASFGPEGVHPTAKAALMVRETLSPASPHFVIAVYPAAGNWTVYRRSRHGGPTMAWAGNWDGTWRAKWRVKWPDGTAFPHVWIRLRRAGNTFTAYGSVDGANWLEVGEPLEPDVPFLAAAHVGLATSSHGEQTPVLPMATVRYEQFGDYVITNAVVTFVQHPASLAVVEHRPVTFAASVQVAGTAASNLYYQWQRNGVSIPDATQLSYSILRATLADHGAHYRVRASLPGGYAVSSEEATLAVGADGTSLAVTSAAALAGGPVAVRFTRALKPDSATNAANYSLQGGPTINQAALMGDGCTVVLTADGPVPKPYQLSVEGVADLASTIVHTTVPVRHLDWAWNDIGKVAKPGLAYAADPAEVNICAAGGNIWTNSDSFLFVHQPRTGDFDVCVQMSHLSRGNSYTRGGLMVRENLTAEGRNLYVCTYSTMPEKRWVSTVRLEPGGTTTLAPGNNYIVRAPTVEFPNVWFRLKRVASTFTAYYGTNGLDWVQSGSQFTPVPPYPPTVHLGFATTPNDANPREPVTARYRHFADWLTTSPESKIESAERRPQPPNRPMTFRPNKN